MVRYDCWYQWWVHDDAQWETRLVSDKPEIPALQGLGAFTLGFWLDKGGSLSHEYDRILYWIPPSRIVYIERYVTDDQT